MEDKVFPSKVDWWLAALLALPPIGGTVALVAMIIGGDMTGIVLGAIGLGIPLAIYLGLVFPMRYTLQTDHIEIRFGLVRSRVPYSQIKGIKPTRNPISSPALSLDRLHIQAGSDMGPNISPADKAAFLEAVAARAPHLKMEGDKLVQASQTA